MFSGAVTPHFAFYDAPPHQQSSPSRFFPASNVNSRPDTASHGPFSHSPSPHGVIPSLGSPAHPHQGYRNIPLPPSPGEPPFTSSPSMANHENAQKSQAVEGRYISRYSECRSALLEYFPGQRVVADNSRLFSSTLPSSSSLNR